MKKTSFVFTAIVFLFGANSYGSDIYWYLAASMAKPGREVVAKYNERKPSARVFLILGGSGQLLSQLHLSKKGDFYTPASADFLKKAMDSGIVKRSRLLLEQKPVFGLSKSGVGKIASFADLTKSGVKIALGNPRTMALGNTYLRVESKMFRETAEKIRNNTIVEAISVSQIVNYIHADIVDAGTIFDTVAEANGIRYVEIPESFNQRNSAYLARLVYSDPAHDLRKFEHFIFDQSAIFAKYGFSLKTTGGK